MTFPFATNEVAALTSFRELFQEMVRHSFLFNAECIISPKFTWKAGGVVETQMTGYDKDSLYSCLILMRHFTSNEPHSFYNACSTLSRHAHTAQRQDILSAIGNMRDAWKRNWDGFGWLKIEKELNGNKIAYSNRYFFDLIVNGRIAHADPEKAEELRNMADFEKNFLMSNLQRCIAHVYVCLMNIDLVADVMMNKPDKRLIIKADAAINKPVLEVAP